ncbi:PREDICTED: protein FAM136A-like [Priapulus caudatus]|uniref:Protein FAM136A-like n=1 Tax=Priapulus caudatus TaxID=37621 RepID=A0ABM1EJ76_PRICU|nr:PREDICTED: protein FAM136A-like [Priapulus caudatus]
MADAAQARVQSAMTKMFEDLDRSHLRNMQGDMYRCSTACCDDKGRNMDQVQKCVDRCSKPIYQAQNFIQGEIQNYQDRLQRCALKCQDDTRDQVTPSTSEAEMARLKDKMEGCVVRCADEHIQLVPALMKRIQEVLQQGGYMKQQQS